MAFVSVPKDLTKIKNKILFNLTKRQLICLSCAAIVGFPLYLLSKGSLGTSTSAVLMVIVMLPFFIVAMYSKDGIPFEQIAANFVRVRFLTPRIRTYETENLYAVIQHEIEVKEVKLRENYDKSSGRAKPRR